MNTNYININKFNLLANINYLKNIYNYSYYILDVSNNAYNHGIYIINYLLDKIDYFYTHNYLDVLHIRKYNQDCKIIYNGEITENNIYELILHNTIIIIKNINTLENILNLNTKEKFNIILNIDINNYNGINSKHIITNIIKLLKDTQINILGIMSNIKEDEYDELKYIISPLKYLELVILNGEFDLNKIKISNTCLLSESIYGVTKTNKKLLKLKNNLNIKQVFNLYSKINNIVIENKKKKEIYYGIIPYGYQNGMISNINKVYINNNFYEIKEIKDEYTIIVIDKNININDSVEITGNNNKINYYSNNPLHVYAILDSNLQIKYDDYIIEKKFNY